MSRLTKKIEDLEKKNQELCIDLGAYQNENENLVKDIEKYWKLEEELGCPLDIFVKIMLGKITEVIVNYGDAEGYEPLYEELTTAYVSGIIDSYEYPDCLCLETNLCDVPVKDYHKNWWLKGEKDEFSKKERKVV